MVAHHTVGGCNLRPGGCLAASGCGSGPAVRCVPVGSCCQPQGASWQPGRPCHGGLRAPSAAESCTPWQPAGELAQGGPHRGRDRVRVRDGVGVRFEGQG